VDGETAAYSETGVACVDYRAEEISIEFEDAIDIKDEVIKVEEAIDIKEEIPEYVTVPPLKAEQEVRLWGVCQVVTAHAFRPFMHPKRKLRNYT
jgi:hypothetical protein